MVRAIQLRAALLVAGFNSSSAESKSLERVLQLQQQAAAPAAAAESGRHEMPDGAGTTRPPGRPAVLRSTDYGIGRLIKDLVCQHVPAGRARPRALVSRDLKWRRHRSICVDIGLQYILRCSASKIQFVS